MSVTCESILNMPELRNNIRLLAGECGLDSAIRWTHILESTESIQFLQGNELTFLTGIKLGKDTGKLLSIIERLTQKHAAGLVINTGKFIPSIPQKAIEKANALSFPLFEIPWNVRLVDVTKLIGTAIVESSMEESSMSYLLEKILLSNQDNFQDYLYSAEFYGYNFTGPMRIAIVDLPHITDSARPSEHTRLINYRQKIRYLIGSVLRSTLHTKLLSMWKNNYFIFILPVNPANDLEQADCIAKLIIKKMTSSLPTLSFFMGLGGYYDQIKQLKISYNEAQLSLKLVEDHTGKKYILYANTGIYQFLNKLQDRSVMAEFYRKTLGKLLLYDQENGTDFTETLHVYLEEGENSANTVQKLFIHRNTLQYRLHRIEEILCQNLKNSDVKISLQIAFKIQKFLTYEGLLTEDELEGSQDKAPQIG
ncbi:MAG TPA: hypothetical protein DEP42_01360 [Ruminococcaceae bacterium]|nr:hypothetical protein [Oscillospiraceae bacterium]